MDIIATNLLQKVKENFQDSFEWELLDDGQEQSAALLGLEYGFWESWKWNRGTHD